MDDTKAYTDSLALEREELDNKILKLGAFIKQYQEAEPENRTPLYCPIRLLEAQKEAMERYSAILGERIFVTDSHITH